MAPAPGGRGEERVLIRRDYNDIIGGAILIGVGLFVAIYALTHYRMGVLRQMGPGMVPTMLGGLLCLLGLAILLPALRRTGRLPAPDYRSAIFVLGATTLFALTIQPFGLVPAIFLMTVAAGYADGKLRLPALVALAAILSAVAYVIFRLVLGIQITIFNWPLQ